MKINETTKLMEQSW